MDGGLGGVRGPGQDLEDLPGLEAKACQAFRNAVTSKPWRAPFFQRDRAEARFAVKPPALLSTLAICWPVVVQFASYAHLCGWIRRSAAPFVTDPGRQVNRDG
jgi:hypothetical protein